MTCSHQNPLPTQAPARPILIFVEGALEVIFLKHISQALKRALDEITDLAALEDQGRVIFLPVGCAVTASTTGRFTPLGLAEFHLYAPKSERELRRRQPIVEALQERPNCKAFIMRKRALENYLHPQVVRTHRGESIDIDDDTDVAMALAQRFAVGNGVCWDSLPRRRRRRMIQHARKWLCTCAVRDMTLQLLEARDRPYELIDWLMTIEDLASASIDGSTQWNGSFGSAAASGQGDLIVCDNLQITLTGAPTEPTVLGGFPCTS